MNRRSFMYGAVVTLAVAGKSTAENVTSALAPKQDGTLEKCLLCGATPEIYVRPGVNDYKEPTLHFSVCCTDCGAEIKIETKCDSIEARNALFKKFLGEEQACFAIGYWKQAFA